MDDLIEALNIFRKYGNETWPTHCEHDVMHIIGISGSDVSEEDIAKLDKLGFILTEDDDFLSFRFGSA